MSETVRVRRVDLERLASMTETDHNGDKWFTTVALWARGVLKENERPPGPPDGPGVPPQPFG